MCANNLNMLYISITYTGIKERPFPNFRDCKLQFGDQSALSNRHRLSKPRLHDPYRFQSMFRMMHLAQECQGQYTTKLKRVNLKHQAFIWS